MSNYSIFMLDIQLLREDPEAVKQSLNRRSPSWATIVDQVLDCDTRRRETETRVQNLRAERNRLSKEIGHLKSRQEDSSVIETQVKGFAAQMEELTILVNALDAEQRHLLLKLPNIPDPSIPDGDDADHNVTIRTWGTPALAGSAEGHEAIAQRLGLFDLERAAKISSSGYVCFSGEGARLERALINFLLDLHTRSHGYTEMGMPLLVRRNCMEGTGQLPKFEEDMYGLDEGSHFLTPTAEVSLTNLYREEIVAERSLPLKLTASTACFRRESGSAGRDTRGIIRMHQFNKVELVK